MPDHTVGFDFELIKSWLWQTKELLALLIGIGALCLSIRTKFIKPGIERFKEFDSAMKSIPGINATIAAAKPLFDDYPELKAKIEGMSKELQDENGGSLKSSVCEIKKQTTAISVKQMSQIECDSEIVAYMNAKGEIENVSHGYTQLTGLDTAQARNEGWKNAMNPDDLKWVVPMWHDSLERQVSFFAEARFINHHTHVVSATKIEARPVFVDGKLHSWVARFKIITQHDTKIPSIAKITDPPLRTSEPAPPIPPPPGMSDDEL